MEKILGFIGNILGRFIAVIIILAIIGAVIGLATLIFVFKWVILVALLILGAIALVLSAIFKR